MTRVFLPYGGCGFRELLAFQNFFVAVGIAIVVYEIQNLGNGVAPHFDGRKTIERLNTPLYGVIYLIFEKRNRHFNVITNLFAVAGHVFFVLIVIKVVIASINTHARALVNVVLSRRRVGVTMWK